MGQAMNEFLKPMLGKPSINGHYCAICGRPATNHHHVIQKGMGGVSKDINKRIPTIVLCGMGNVNGCHGLAHTGRLHFRFNGKWQYLLTKKSIGYSSALESTGWRDIRIPEDDELSWPKEDANAR